MDALASIYSQEGVAWDRRGAPVDTCHVGKVLAGRHQKRAAALALARGTILSPSVRVETWRSWLGKNEGCDEGLLLVTAIQPLLVLAPHALPPMVHLS